MFIVKLLCCYAQLAKQYSGTFSNIVLNLRCIPSWLGNLAEHSENTVVDKQSCGAFRIKV
jgi:hypothetical protein